MCVHCTEIHAANETCTYLMKLIHEIGLELRSSAVCTGLRRLRYGPFTLVHALLTKHCDARSIAENIEFCRPLVIDTLRRRRSETIQTDTTIGTHGTIETDTTIGLDTAIETDNSVEEIEQLQLDTRSE